MAYNYYGFLVGDEYVEVPAETLEDAQKVLPEAQNVPVRPSWEFAWQGGEWVHVVSTPVIPERVTARQFGLQLIAAGIKGQVDTWIASQDDATKWAYERSATFVRDDPMMQSGFASLGFTTQQVDDFFIAASKL